MVLYVGRVHPYDERHSAVASYPSVAILRTCRFLHEEAEPLLYQNVFTFATQESLKRYLEPFMRIKRGYKAPVQKLEVTFKWTSFDSADTQDIVEETMFQQLVDDTAAKPIGNVTARYSHQAEKEMLRTRVWKGMADLIVDKMAPRQLTLDLRECLCRDKCCSMQMGAVGCFNSGFAFGVVPEVRERGGFKGLDINASSSRNCQLISTIFNIWTSRRLSPSVELHSGELGPSWEDQFIWDVFLEEMVAGCRGAEPILPSEDLTSAFREFRLRNSTSPRTPLNRKYPRTTFTYHGANEFSYDTNGGFFAKEGAPSSGSDKVFEPGK